MREQEVKHTLAVKWAREDVRESMPGKLADIFLLVLRQRETADLQKTYEPHFLEKPCSAAPDKACNRLTCAAAIRQCSRVAASTGCLEDAAPAQGRCADDVKLEHRKRSNFSSISSNVSSWSQSKLSQSWILAWVSACLAGV